MKRIASICVTILLFYSFHSMAQVNEKDFSSKLDTYIQQVMGKLPEIPGIAIVVIKDDHPLFVRAYGMADKEQGTKADVNTLFYIASSTKSFTALSAALLDKEGLIKLDDPMIKYAKGVHFKETIPERITIRDLLTHTSGLQNDPLTFRMAYSGAVEKKDILDVFANATKAIDSSYGKYSYDNLGYNIYAVLLQQTLNKKWQDLLEEKIFVPLKMQHTTAYISKAAANKWTVAAPYIYTPDKGSIRSWLGKTDNNMQSAGGLFASISDIGTWLMMNMNNGKLNGKQVIPADIIKKCQTGYTTTLRDQAPFTGEGEYGLGWQIGKYKNEKVIYHHGGFPGYRSHISFMPEKKIAVAVLINEGSVGGRTCHTIATYVYDSWLQGGNVDETYTKQLEDFVNSFAKTKKSAENAFAERARRISQLSLPLENYTGKYIHPYFGTMEISVKDNSLAVRIGEMYCVSTPYTQRESIRVELEPGSGTWLQFTRNEDKIDAVSYEGIEFVRVK